MAIVRVHAWLPRFHRAGPSTSLDKTDVGRPQRETMQLRGMIAQVACNVKPTARRLWFDSAHLW